MAEKEREALVKLYNIAHYITVKDVRKNIFACLLMGEVSLET